MRRLGNRQVKTDVRLGGDIRVAALRGLKAGDEFLFVGVGCPHGRVPGGTGFDGVTRFKDVEAVVRVVLHQRLQRLHDVLLGPVVMLPAYKGAAAATAHQHPFANQRRQRLTQRIARHAKLGGELAFGGQLHARFQLLFFNQRPHARGNLVGQASGHYYHGIIQVKT